MTNFLFNPDALVIDRNLLFEFFVVFSKFEFALKNSTFLKGDERTAEPDWECSARSLRNSFKSSVNPILQEACDYLLSNPPMKQVMVDGKLAWSTTGPNGSLSEVERLLVLVRRVRNNLFHGGKFSAEAFEDTPRQERLLRSSLIVLAECLRLDNDVRGFFDLATI